MPYYSTPEAGGDFPSDWLSKHINAKEMLDLHEALQQVCVTHSGSLQRAPVAPDVDTQSGLHAFRRERARDSSRVVDNTTF